MTGDPERGDEAYRGLLNPAYPAGRHRLLDRNSDPARFLPPIPDERVDRPCDPHCERGS